ncbi:hypothetical protein ASD76_17655 [Altererythrobacter sp. Root672]|nr:hypothetical protein ASD76_17655 [Altererythrobacter sp. Root672]
MFTQGPMRVLALVSTGVADDVGVGEGEGVTVGVGVGAPAPAEGPEPPPQDDSATTPHVSTAPIAQAFFQRAERARMIQASPLFLLALPCRDPAYGVNRQPV